MAADSVAPAPAQLRGAGPILYRACADVLALAAQLPLASALPTPAELRQQLTATLDKMVSRGRRADLPEDDLAEARYAFVALLDEQVLKASWSSRAEWMNRPLQFDLYQDNNAGEDFFVRFAALLRNGSRPLAVQAYYLCLALGFQGMFGSSGDRRRLAEFEHAARRQLAALHPLADRLGPHAIPRRRDTTEQRGARLGSLLVVTALLVALTIASSGWSIHRALGNALLELTATPRSSSGSVQ